MVFFSVAPTCLPVGRPRVGARERKKGEKERKEQTKMVRSRELETFHGQEVFGHFLGSRFADI